MFAFIKSLFRYTPDSLDGFIESAKAGECRSVTIRPDSRVLSGAETLSLGLIADFQYLLEFTATTIKGRKIIYRERLFERHGTEYGLADSGLRSEAVIKLYLTGEQRMKLLRTKFRNVPINLIGPDDRIMTAKMFARLHRDAAACGVSV